LSYRRLLSLNRISYRLFYYLWHRLYVRILYRIYFTTTYDSAFNYCIGLCSNRLLNLLRLVNYYILFNFLIFNSRLFTFLSYHFIINFLLWDIFYICISIYLWYIFCLVFNNLIFLKLFFMRNHLRGRYWFIFNICSFIRYMFYSWLSLYFTLLSYFSTNKLSISLWCFYLLSSYFLYWCIWLSNYRCILPYWLKISSL